MTSKIVVNNIESDAGVSTVFFNSDIGGTGGTLNIEGDINIKGVVTYEDVTNIDSVGVVTARRGIVSSGVVTATAFHGDGSQLTGIDATQIVTGNTSVQTVDTGSDGHVKVNIEGSERLRIMSDGTVKIGTGTGNPILMLSASTSGTSVIQMGDTADNNIGQIHYVNSDDSMRFFTNNAERLRLKSDGKAYFTGNLGLGGQTSPASTIHINDLSANGYELKVTGNAVQFNRSSNSYIDQLHDTGSILFRMTSSNTEAMRITSAGFIGINETSPSTHLHVEQDNAHSSTYYLNSDAAILVSNNNNSGKAVLKLEGDGALVYGGGNSPLLVADRQYERYRINENGNTIFQGAASPGNGNTGNAAILVRGKSVSGSSTTVDLNISQSYSTNGIGLEIQEHSNTANALATLVFNHGSLKSMIASSRIVTNEWGTDLRFYTHPPSTSSADQHKVYERLRIDSSGRLLLGTTTEGYVSADNFTIADTGNCGLTIRSASNALGTIAFSDATSGDGEYSAFIQYNHGNRHLTFGTESDDHVRIDNNGHLEIDYDGSNNARVQFGFASGVWITGNSSDGHQRFYTNSGERIRSGYNGQGTEFRNQNSVRPGADNSIDLGSGSYRYDDVYATNGTIQTSDSRLKQEVVTSVLGIDFIKALRPVSYKWIEGKKVPIVDSVDANGDNVYRSDDDNNWVYESRAGARRHWGFIAQEVKQAVDDAGVDFAGWTLSDKDDPDSTQSLRYEEFIAPLTKALQEAITKIEALEAAVAALQGS